MSTQGLQPRRLQQRILNCVYSVLARSSVMRKPWWQMGSLWKHQRVVRSDGTASSNLWYLPVSLSNSVIFAT